MLKQLKGFSMIKWQKHTALTSTSLIPKWPLLKSCAYLSSLAITSVFVSSVALAEVEQFSLSDNTLSVKTSTNDFTVTVLGHNSFQITYTTDDNGAVYNNLPSMALPTEQLNSHVIAPKVHE